MTAPATRSADSYTTKEVPEVIRFVDLVHSGKPGLNSFVLLLGLRQLDSVALLKTVERGLAFRSFETLQRSLGVSQARLLDMVQIPQRTLTRRRSEGRLHADESDRLLRAGRLLGVAIELFDGDAVAARNWLSSPQTVLGGAVPLDLARTDLGAREVERAIGRIEHGVFS